MRHHDRPLDAASLAPRWGATGRGPQPVRWDRVHQVRAAIARGDYETPEKWAVVVERLLAERLAG